MANTALVNNVDHQDLKVKNGHGSDFGDAVNSALVFPTEYGEIQREYPILFRRDEEGKFQSVALLGFEKGENLYLSYGGWQARYVPAMHRKGPFMIGFQNQDVDGETRRERVIHIDLDDPRVSRTDGQPLFLEHGGNAPVLEAASRTLHLIDEGVKVSGAMFAAFEEAGLIEPVALDVTLDRETVYKLPGFFTIGEEKLANLDAQTLERLHRPGYLRAAYLVIASLPNINWLIGMKNQKRRGG